MMSGGAQLVGRWPDVAEEPRGDDAPLDLEQFALDDTIIEPVEKRDWGLIFATVICTSLAAAWLGLVGAIYLPRWIGAPPALESLAGAIALASPPLAVLALIYALALRNSRSVARRMTDASAIMRAEQARLEVALAHVSGTLSREQGELAEANDKLMTLGEEAVHRMKVASLAMRDEVETLTRYGQALKFSATSARADLAVLLADLPKAQLETRQMVSALQEAGMTAHERAGALDAQLASLTTRGREADEIAGGAAQKLAAHLARIETVSAAAGTQLEQTAATMTDAIDGALARAATAGDAARQNMEAQGTTMLALVDQTHAALARTGADAADAIAQRVDDVTGKLQALDARLASQSDVSARLLADIGAGLVGIDAHFATLDREGAGRAERLATAIGALGDNAAVLTTTLTAGTAHADALIGRTETLLTALDASVREIDETMPAALTRLDAKVETSNAKIALAAPKVTALEQSASGALDRLIEAEALLSRQCEVLDTMTSDTEQRLHASRAAAAQLVAVVTTAEETTRGLAEGAGHQLIDAMVRVREAAQSATERAREAIGSVIPEAAEKFAADSRAALTDAITHEVNSRLAELTATAEQAVAAASKASDKLMRQMLTISETSAAVEARIAEARSDVEKGDRDNFARRVALLIESLNSTAIDVSKLLSNDVSDSAWASYLRGDRGVFTRRAVRLLDSAEVKEVVRNYDADSEFREQVNRYIHDFEAMLRNILATRDGSSLGVTLLSSDMGKLYVALAQAIERLRS